MPSATTPNVEGRRIVACHGIVSGEAILGTNVFRDVFASIRDFVGGRSGASGRVIGDVRRAALDETAGGAQRPGGNAVIGVGLDDGALGTSDSMLMVTATGRAVTIA